MNSVPQSNRLHITIYGRCNSGKSSLLNAIAGQRVAVVSEVAGTTTDTVHKPIEVPGLGACLFIDTPGLDDLSPMGMKRIEQASDTLLMTEMAIMMFGNPDVEEEVRWMRFLRAQKVPIIGVINDNYKAYVDVPAMMKTVKEEAGLNAVVLNAKTGDGVEGLFQVMMAHLPKNDDEPTIMGNLVEPGDKVLLVMPQDEAAPKGRLILPQAQTIRELLDRQCIPICCTPAQLEPTLCALSASPKLVITDSQLFSSIHKKIPQESKLTSFSILFAHYKGDLKHFVEGARALDNLSWRARILIAEACTHVPVGEDIGRVKIPRLLHLKFGYGIKIDTVSGSDFPDDLTGYDLVIHCGACMFNRKHVLSRVNRAVQQGVPITNYGIALAHLMGILEKLVFPS